MWLLLACAAPDEGDTSADSDTASDTSGDSGEDTADAGEDTAADCPTAEPGALREVTETPAGPYLVRHPVAPDDATATIIYLPGGDGGRGGAQAIEELYLRGEGHEAFRVVVPWTDGARDFSAIPERAIEVREEVLRCFGGDPARVHLGGTSNGGVGSFALMVEQGEGFASLLGAPGAWEDWDEGAIVAALGDKPVYMGVGSEDADWAAYMEPQAEALAAAGVDVTWAVFEGQGHVVDEAFDESVLFAFWGR